MDNDPQHSKLFGYGVDPFSINRPKHLTCGEEIDHTVFVDMLKSADIRRDQFRAFVTRDSLQKILVSFCQ